jgi:hypothetical protein
MAEEWRIKRYYQPRVLIGVEDTLSCPYPGLVVCLEGSELNVLRNLLQYAHRRATWVSEYHTSYYLAPDNDEWDNIESLVDGLEGKLMSCSELIDSITSIAAAINCICQMIQSLQAQKQPQDEGYTDQPYYDEYRSTVHEREGDPPGEFATWDDWLVAKCKASQKLVDDAIVANQQIGQQLTSGILITFSGINLLLTLTVISIPVSIVIQIVATLVAIGVNYLYEDVVAWLTEHKESLVCAIYTASNVSAAYSAITAYMAAEWDVSTPSDIVAGMFNYEVLSDIFDGTIRDYELWESGYSESYCDACAETLEGHEFVWQWPPCPNGVFMDGGICYDGRLCFNADIDDAQQQFVNDLDPFNRCNFEVHWRSALGSGFTVGAVYLDRWDTGLEDWVQRAAYSTTNHVAAGELNATGGYSDISPDEHAGLFRIRIAGAAGQHETEPYPMMLEYVAFLLSYVAPP